jgi:hypothetical protein
MRVADAKALTLLAPGDDHRHFPEEQMKVDAAFPRRQQQEACRCRDLGGTRKVRPQSVLKIEQPSKNPEPTPGLEPGTPSLRVKCSTN